MTPTPQTEARSAPRPSTGANSGTRRPIGIGLIGFGWLGQAHTRSMQRIRTLFEEREFDPVLKHVSDTVPARLGEATRSFGYERGSADWRRVVDEPEVEIVVRRRLSPPPRWLRCLGCHGLFRHPPASARSGCWSSQSIGHTEQVLIVEETGHAARCCQLKPPTVSRVALAGQRC